MCPGSPYLRCADMDADQLTEIQAQDLPEGIETQHSRPQTHRPSPEYHAAFDNCFIKLLIIISIVNSLISYL